MSGLGRMLGVVLAGATTLACHRIVDGVDPEPLGYGPGPSAQLGEGYDPDPVPRPAPTPWEPPTRQPASTLGKLGVPSDAPVPPSQDVIQVCKHITALDETNDPSAPEECLRRYQIEQVFRTLPDWKTYAACVEAARDPGAIEACARATPRAFAEAADYPLESQVCLHLFALTLVEELGPDPQLDREELVEFEAVLHECVDGFVEDERSARSPSEYLELLACIDQARTSTAAERCQ